VGNAAKSVHQQADLVPREPPFVTRLDVENSERRTGQNALGVAAFVMRGKVSPGRPPEKGRRAAAAFVSSSVMGVQLPEWMAGGYTVIRADRTTAMVRNDFVDSFQRHRLMDCPRAPVLSLPETDGEAEDPLAGGRGGIRVVAAGSLGGAVVRPYRRGGLVEKINRRRYFVGDRAFSELVSTHLLRKRGAPVPEALAAVQTTMRLGYQACLVTRLIPNAPPAAALLAAVPGSNVARILDSMGQAIRLLHESGGVHADLNAHNILVSEAGEGPAFVIDLDRVTLTACPAPERRTRAALLRLRRSFVKLGLDQALREWDRLEQGFSAPPEPRPAA
jgi:3-deoxy-D-manno-octulosonic acid kinase